MTYEPGVLVRRQQREYPPELRREIATMALEVGNNREVARLYSERLGYTVNESTVRGIKKRYLEGVQKGKIESPGLSPRSGNESSNQGDRDSDAEGDAIIQPENCMRLQLDVLEGKMKDRLEDEDEEDMDSHDMEDMNTSTLVISESALSINGEDSRDSCNQLSIDTGETDQDLVQTAAIAKPSIRIAKGLTTRDNNENHAPAAMGGILAATLQAGIKRKQSNGGPLVSPMFSNGGGQAQAPLQGPVVKKQRPNATENDQEIVGLEKEVRALQWLARRKEKEWDQVISLLKQKEEKLVKAQRARVLIHREAEHLLSKHKPVTSAASHPPQPLASPAQMVLPGSATLAPVIVPQQQVLILPSSVTMSSPLNTVNTHTTRLIQPKPVTVKPVTSAPIVTNLTTKAVLSSASVNLRSKSPGAAQKQTNGALSHSEQSPEQKIVSTAERAAKNLQKAASGAISASPKEEVKKSTPDCQGCGKKKSEFVCAGCSNRWYCSRECQVEDWDEHADECSG